MILIDVSSWAGAYNASGVDGMYSGVGRVEKNLALALRDLCEEVRLCSGVFSVEGTLILEKEGYPANWSIEGGPGKLERKLVDFCHIPVSFAKSRLAASLQGLAWRCWQGYTGFRRAQINQDSREGYGSAALIQFDYTKEIELLAPQARQMVVVYDLIPITDRHFGQPELRQREIARLEKLRDQGAHFIGISEWVARDVQNFLNLDDSRVHWFRCGLDQNFAPCTDREKIAWWRDKIGLESAQRYFVAQTGEIRRKNLAQAVRAVANVRKQTNENHGLVLAGYPKRVRDELRAALPEIDDWENWTFFTGDLRDEDFAAIYADAVCLLFLSLAEGFGYAPLEAMACGLPSVSSNASSIPEVVGDAGILVDPENMDQITNAMVRMLNDQTLRAQLVKKGLARAKLFTWKAAAQRTMAAWQKLLLEKE